jgi:hypothetical protein
MSAISPICFGVEPRADGSVVVAAQSDGELRVQRFEPARAQVPAVVQFVRERSLSPHVCVAAIGAGALALALAFGELPEAEVILLRPAALPRASAAAAKPANDDGVAVALARYARRAA